VPISYGNKEKVAGSRIKEDPNLDRRVLVSLPRIGFELTDFQYDGSRRKLNKMTQLRSDDPSAVGTVATMYTPVPWNLGFNVYILTKTADDALRIIEQILPFFTPGYTVTINAVPEMGITQEIPVVLAGVSYEDNATDGPMEERREIKYTLNFTMKAELWGPMSDSEHHPAHAHPAGYREESVPAPAQRRRGGRSRGRLHHRGRLVRRSHQLIVPISIATGKVYFADFDFLRKLLSGIRYTSEPLTSEPVK
jgi:hypothetical protein